MNHTAQDLRALQARIRNGDRSAIEQFRQQLLPSLKWIIQRATRSKQDVSPLTRAIRGLAAQFDLSGSGSAQAQRGLDGLACRLCDLLIARFESMSRPNQAVFQTVKGNVAVVTQA